MTNIKTLLAVGFFLVHLGSALEAQTTATATYVKQHRLGESFQEWLTISKLDLVAACQDLQAEGVRSLSELIIVTNTPNERAISATHESSCKELLAIQHSGSALLILNSTEWRISRGKVAEITIHNDLSDTTTGEQIAFLTDKYGKPSTVTTVSYQNGYGASWQCPEVIWVRPDGTIVAIEFPMLDFRRSFTVSFYSKERLKEIEAAGSKNNPYDQ